MDKVRPVRSSKMHDRPPLMIWHAVYGDPLDRSLELAAVSRLNHYAGGLAFLLLLSQFVAPGAFAQDRESLERPTTIRGTVINRITREPIGRALVYSADNRFARLTDSEGHFEYPIPKAAPAELGNSPGIQTQAQGDFAFCCVMARKPGFVADPNEEQGVEISADREPTIALTPEGHIKGRVLLPSSDAATGITRTAVFPPSAGWGVPMDTGPHGAGKFEWRVPVRGTSARRVQTGDSRVDGYRSDHDAARRSTLRISADLLSCCPRLRSGRADRVESRADLRSGYLSCAPALLSREDSRLRRHCEWHDHGLHPGS